MLLLLLACHPDVKPDDTPVPALDLGETLSAEEVRAGVITDPAWAFGGISAEGDIGDVKIYNDRVQFVIQGLVASDYYAQYGGTLIDADIVREEGVPGRDLLDEYLVMAGFGRVVDAESVDVSADGSGGQAVVRVSGHGAPLTLATGALESPALVPDVSLSVTTDYSLDPGSWALHVETTVENLSGVEQTLVVGDVGIVALEAAAPWSPGMGYDVEQGEDSDWVGLMGDHNEVAVAILGDGEQLAQGTIGALLSGLAPTVSGFAPTFTVPVGGTITWSRYFGTAPDLATLSDAQDGWWERENEEASGTVTADGAPVAGARVTVLDAAGLPTTQAVTAADGTWSAKVAVGDRQYVASGRGEGYDMDLPAGHAWYGPYAADPSAALTSLENGAAEAPFAEGYGYSAPSDGPDLALTPPGQVEVQVVDGGPAVARFTLLSDAVGDDDRVVPGRPGSATRWGFIRDGSLTLSLEPGDYELVVYRGVRDEVHVETVTVASGASVTVDADISAAYTLTGVVTGDPHTHASPSGDGDLPMEDRLLTMAANGVDLHFGTDHDHIVDYHPLLAPLGLSGRLRSVVADEVSPVLRGHFNMWPAAPGEGANHGAPLWWEGYLDTAEIFGWMRVIVGEEGVISANHPVGSSGMFELAGYDPIAGTIAEADHWSDDFDAMEVMNSGEWQPYFPYYLDLVNRGYAVTPLGVSDSHGPTSGNLGASLTFFLTGTDFSGATDEVLTATMARGATVVSNGPFVEAMIGGAAAPGTTVLGEATLSVVVRAPSWIPVDTVTLYENGIPTASFTCTGAAPMPCETTFALAPAADAAYVVVASSATPMLYAHAGDYPWAMTAATFVDVAGDGWEAPSSALFR